MEQKVTKNNSNTSKAKIAILGGGFAGVSAARVFNDNYSVTLVDKDSHFEWSPNIHELLSDIKNIDNLTLSYQSLLTCSKHRFMQDEVSEVNPETNTVKYQSGLSETYDAIILCLGHKTEHYGIDGAKEQTLPFKRIDDAVALKQRLEKVLSENTSNQRNTTISVVGGGFTGLEVLGELHRKYQSQPGIRFQLIEKQPFLLNGKFKEVGNSISQLCDTNGIDLYLDSEIARFNPGKIRLTNGQTLESDLTIWTAGTSSEALVNSDSSAFIKSSSGLSTNDFLQAKRTGNGLDGQSYEKVFIAGDLANTDTNQAKQAYHALNMGELAAKNCISSFEDSPLERYRPQAEFSLLSFGSMNTYALTPYGCASSPLLAAAKESVFQLQMANLSRGLPMNDQVSSILQRNITSITKLALPQLRFFTPKNLFEKSNFFF